MRLPLWKHDVNILGDRAQPTSLHSYLPSFFPHISNPDHRYHCRSRRLIVLVLGTLFFALPYERQHKFELLLITHVLDPALVLPELDVSERGVPDDDDASGVSLSERWRRKCATDVMGNDGEGIGDGAGGRGWRAGARVLGRNRTRRLRVSPRSRDRQRLFWEKEEKAERRRVMRIGIRKRKVTRVAKRKKEGWHHPSAGEIGGSNARRGGLGWNWQALWRSVLW